MAKFKLNFKSSEVIDEKNMAGGVYSAKILVAEVKDSKAGDKNILHLHFRLSGGKVDGVVVRHYITFGPKGEELTPMAKKELKRIATALDKEEIDDVDDLVGGLLLIEVQPEADSEYMKVKKYAPLSAEGKVGATVAKGSAVPTTKPASRFGAKKTEPAAPELEVGTVAEDDIPF